jgi:hemoglobin/transferrin/lactoferrin receptor protein
MKKYILPIILLGLSIGAYAQQVKDKSSLKNIPNATIQLDDSSNIELNSKGKFELSDVAKSKTITIKAIGYFPLLIETNSLTSESVIYLEEKAYETAEVVISASKFEEKQSDVPNQIMVIKSKDLEFINAQNSGDVLQQSGNVYVQKSQMGGGSPILRGYEANKVLMVVDGVRMNNAIYRDYVHFSGFKEIWYEPEIGLCATDGRTSGLDRPVKIANINGSSAKIVGREKDFKLKF